MDFIPNWVSKMDIEVVSNEKTTKAKTEFELALETALFENDKEEYNKKPEYKSEQGLTHNPFRQLRRS